MQLERPQPHQLVIKANGLSPQRPYVARVTVDGRPLSGNHITYDQLINAREIIFDMTDSPQ